MRWIRDESVRSKKKLGKKGSVSDEEGKSLSRPVNVCTVCAHSFDETVFLPAPVLSR